MSYTIIN